MVRIDNPEQWSVSDIEVAKNGKHKYVAILQDGNGYVRRVPFGDINYGHYHDRLGAYANLDHFDDERRRSFDRRHAHNTQHKFSSAWFAKHILW